MSMSQKQGLYRSAFFQDKLFIGVIIPNVYHYMVIFPASTQFWAYPFERALFSAPNRFLLIN